MQIRKTLLEHGVKLAENEKVERIDRLNVKVKRKFTSYSAIQYDLFGAPMQVCEEETEYEKEKQIQDDK